MHWKQWDSYHLLASLFVACGVCDLGIEACSALELAVICAGWKHHLRAVDDNQGPYLSTMFAQFCAYMQTLTYTHRIRFFNFFLCLRRCTHLEPLLTTTTNKLPGVNVGKAISGTDTQTNCAVIRYAYLTDYCSCRRTFLFSFGKWVKCLSE